MGTATPTIRRPDDRLRWGAPFYPPATGDLSASGGLARPEPSP